MRNTLIPILVAICLFITGVAILNIQLWYSAKAEYLAGARYAANNINHILEEASQATQTAVNIAGKECDLEEQYQLGTEAALKPEKVHSTKYHFTIIFNPPPLFSFYRLIDKGFGILIFILLIACAAAFLLDRYFNKSATPEEILRRAINNGEIVPFYQPVVNGREGTLRGVEVLARWKQPHGGYISPAAFIPLAE
ncbi:TPA: EAL domain-containing protein, partial [Escherichia coli]